MRSGFLISLLCLAFPASGVSQVRDILVLVDSRTLEQEASFRIVERAMAQLVRRLGPSNRLGLSIIGTEPTWLRPLETVTGDRISGFDWNGITPPAPTLHAAFALEWAIYQLRTAARPDAATSLIVMGDTRIDPSDAQGDAELSAWMRDSLSAEAAQAGIKIYWLTFSEAANYRVIQTVTQKTRGSYYRAFNPDAAQASMDKILTAAPASATVAADSTVVNGTGSSALPPLDPRYALALAGVFAILFAGLYLRRRLRPTPEQSASAGATETSRVTLRDLSRFTGKSQYDITRKYTLIGRQPREVTTRNCIVVISDASVGRNHASIASDADGYWLSDTGSVNGTYLNGRRIHQSTHLSDGDRIRFAKFEFEISIPPATRHADGADTASSLETKNQTDPSPIPQSLRAQQARLLSRR